MVSRKLKPAVKETDENSDSRAYSYKIGPHKIIRGDCLSVLKKMKASSVDVIITSPPYNLGINYSAYKDRKKEEDYLDWLEAICLEIKRVMKDHGSFFLNIAGSSSNPWLPFELILRLRKIFHLQNHIDWVKSISIGDESYGHFKPVLSERFLHRNHEYIFHLTKSGCVKLSRLNIGVPYKDKSNIARRKHLQDRRCRGDVWFIPYDTVRAKAQKFNHPGTFPIMLPKMCLRLTGLENPTVLDPFLGTGTTLLAAQQEGGKGIGIDIDKNYIRISRDRLQRCLDIDATS